MALHAQLRQQIDQLLRQAGKVIVKQGFGTRRLPVGNKRQDRAGHLVELTMKQDEMLEMPPRDMPVVFAMKPDTQAATGVIDNRRDLQVMPLDSKDNILQA